MAPTERRFLRSLYLTLALACTCLGYAEFEFLPWIGLFTGVVLVLLAVAFRLEGRWALSIRWANVIGLVMALAALKWVAGAIAQQDKDFADEFVPMSARLPLLGPLLMILVPAKLFRPKHNGDYWGLQGIGLIAVALGCALTADPVYGVLMLAYLVSTLCTLTLFYYYRQETRVGSPPRPVGVPRVLVQAGWWAGAVTLVSLGLFLCTPRITEAQIPTTVSRLQTGVEESRPAIDLNRSGTLNINRDRVFEVRAFTKDIPNPPPKLDVDPGQRWRQTVFNYYSGGRWDLREIGFGPPRSRQPPHPRGLADSPPNPGRNASRLLADLGPGQFYFEFHMIRPTPGTMRVRAEPVASPVGPNGERRTIIASVGGSGRFPWIGQRGGELSPPAFASQSVYDQVVLPPEESGVGPAESFDPLTLDNMRNSQAVPRLQAWSRQLLQMLVDLGRLPRGVLGGQCYLPLFPQWVPGWVQEPAVRFLVARGYLPKTMVCDQVPPAYYEAVAREFEAFLARSGQFRYSTELTRRDFGVDPIEDFVLFTRRGHCTRFATALALMLRSVGVPTRIVLGYRGFETAGDGILDVLQCHAHSWVEAVIYRPPGKPGDPPWHWLTLDPTPGAEDENQADSGWGQWWQSTRQGVSTFFKNFIVEYDADRQERTRNAVSRSGWWAVPHEIGRLALRPESAIIALVGIAAAYVARSAVRRRRAANGRPADPVIAAYERLTALLRTKLAMAPRRGQTPREFAGAAAQRLGTDPQTKPYADLPTAAVALYYRVRFGGLRVLEVDVERLSGRTIQLAKVLGAAG